MTTTPDIPAQLEAFAAAYDYDTTYLRTLHDASPGAFAAFHGARGLAEYRRMLTLEAHFVARIAAMQSEDCGACGQLNVRMAIEAGVDRQLLRDLLDHPERLPELLRDIRDHAVAAAAGGEGAHAVAAKERTDRLRWALGAEGFAELAALITGCRLYPGLKRALGVPAACTPLRVDT